MVSVSGVLKVDKYLKKDGTTGMSLEIENPPEFNRLSISDSNSQIQQDVPGESEAHPEDRINAVTAAISADNDAWDNKQSYTAQQPMYFSEYDEEEALY